MQNLNFIILLQKSIIYGCLGMLIEVLFTSINSLRKKHWKGTGNTYLWMFFIYGPTGLMLDEINHSLDWPFYLKAFLYLPVIFGAEALSGWTLKKVTYCLEKWFGGTGGGVVPWEYSKSKWSPMGLINLQYAPLWLLLAMAFGPISSFLYKVLVLTSKSML